jgi:hypothetical protein
MNSSNFKRGRRKNEAQRLWRRRRAASDLIVSRRLSTDDHNTLLRDVSDPVSVETIDSHHDGTSESSCSPRPVNDDNNVHEIVSMASNDDSEATSDRSDTSDSSSSDEPSIGDLSIDLDDGTPLYRQSPISLHKSAISLIRFCRRVNLNKQGVKHLLDTVRDLLPIPNALPRTLPGLLREAGIGPSKRVTYHCCQCMTRLNSGHDPLCSPRCSLHDHPRLPVHVGELYAADVEKQLKVVAEKHLSLINGYVHNRHLLPCDIPNSGIFQQLPRFAGQKHLTLLLQTDGAPLVKLGAKSLWPIQATIAEIPPPVRDYKSGVMVLGAWLGSTHPSRDLLWRKIVDQIRVSVHWTLRSRSSFAHMDRTMPFLFLYVSVALQKWHYPAFS